MDQDKVIKQAVILAGGRGERLKPLTDNCPKPMVKVHGRPFLEYVINVLKKSGVEEIVLLLGYLHEKVSDYFGDGTKFGMKIKYSIGEVSDDTGTRVRNAKSLLAENFLLIYGDVYWPFLDLEKMSEFYYASGKLGLVVVCDKGESKPNIQVDEGNNVLSYVYGPEAGDSKFNWTEVGVFIMNRKIADFMPENINFSWNKITLPDLTARNQLIAWKTNKAPDTITNPAHLSAFADKIKAPKF